MRVYWIGVFTGIEGSVTKRKRLSSTSFKKSQGTYMHMSFGTCMRFLTVEIASRRVTSHQGTHVCIGCHGGSIDLQYIPSSFTGFPLERTLSWRSGEST